MRLINKFNAFWVIAICLIIATVFGTIYTPPQKLNDILANQGYTNIDIQKVSLNPFLCGNRQYGYPFTARNNINKEISGVGCTYLFSSTFVIHFEQ